MKFRHWILSFLSALFISLSSIDAASLSETFSIEANAPTYGPYTLERVGPDGLEAGSVAVQIDGETMQDSVLSETMGQFLSDRFNGYVMYDTGVFSLWPNEPLNTNTTLTISYQSDTGEESVEGEIPIEEEAPSREDDSSEETNDTPQEVASGRSGLPEGKQGKFPIQIPQYDGMDQFLLLSNTWVVLGNVNLESVAEEIARLVRNDSEWSTIDFLAEQERWKTTSAEGAPDYYRKKRYVDAPIERYLGQARKNIGEELLDDPITWTITSNDDPAYSSEEHPVQVSRYIISLGFEKLSGMDPHYAHYSYLNLPYPMKNGKTYTIRGHYTHPRPDGANEVFDRSVTFTYDEFTLVSRSIKANQIGYLPSAEKWAYLGAFIPGIGAWDKGDISSFKVINAKTGAEAYSGTVNLRKDYANPRYLPRGNEKPEDQPLVSGENIYEMDFSSITEPGVYFLVVEGVGRSWPFVIDRNAYSEAFYVMARGMYHKRCGVELKQPYTFWPRIECHTDPVGESDYIPLYFYSVLKPKGWADFDIIGGTWDFSNPTEDATGGWHDAGDWDKRIMHYTNVFDLLSVYELKPNNFYDGQLNLPESGNGIPDVLDEAEYGLLVWKKSMTPEGGVAGRLETNTHPTIDDKEHPFAYSKRTRWSSLLFAAAAAQYAKLVEPYDADKSAEYSELAKRAYSYGTDPNNSLGTITIYPKKNRGAGETYSITYTEEEQFNKPMLMAAKLRLFQLTGEETYLEGLDSILESFKTEYRYENVKIRFFPAQWPFSTQDASIWFYSPLFTPELEPHLNTKQREFWRNEFVKFADRLANQSQEEYYRRSKGLDEDYRNDWGFGTMTNVARVLLYTYHLTGDERYKQAALFNADYMLGANATGMAWTSGLGYVYPVPIHDNVTLNDGIQDPVPGIQIYGPSQRHFDAPADKVYNIRYPDGTEEHALDDSLYVGKKIVLPLWRNWIPHEKFNVSMNEYTIHETMSSAIFVYGYLLDEDWQAPDWVKVEPRDKRYLFGWWYLP